MRVKILKFEPSITSNGLNKYKNWCVVEAMLKASQALKKKSHQSSTQINSQ